MNLQGQQIKDTYGGVLNIGSAGLSGSLVNITDGEGNVLPIEVSSTTINFTGNVTGLTGAAGSSGTSGTSGVNGSSGASGSNGTSGVNGSSGTSGAAGANGSSGTSGVSGTNGSSGSSGAAGANGSSGTSGAAGANGSSGTSGLSGANGSSGSSGAAGANGSSGTSGADGSSGSSGLSGSSGSSGAAGANGSSGTSGSSGAAGANGSSGTSGADGSSGSSGLSGSSGSSGAAGANGSSGTSGAAGANGSSGTSGVSGTNGSSGTSGIDGSSGTSGIDGSSGTSGAAGVSGSSGTSGADGSSGTSGANGSSGTSGIDGSSGTSGTSGVSGATGPAGAGSAISSPGNTRLLTSDGTTGGVNAQSNLTFNGTVLGVTGQAATYLYANGNFTGTGTVNFNNSNTQSLTLTGSTTITFSNPVIGAVYNVKVVQGGAGSYTITWPGSVSWLGSTPTLQTTVGAVDLFSFIYDGTNYIGASAISTSGSSGTSGINGATGANGTSGTSGINGATGANGTSGTSGVNGATGAQGATGSGSSITSPGNNRVLTSDGTASGLVAESNLTFNGNVLGVTGQAATYLYDNGNFTGTGTINFNNSNVQALTLTGSTTLTLTNPTSGGVYTLQVIQGGAGGYNISWPGSVIFIDGVPALATVIGAVDIISIMYDGANYYGAQVGTPQGLVYTSATQAVLAATGAANNINIAISPKGTGAFSLNAPDGGTAGGDARGIYAVDLTLIRGNSNQVASGAYSIAGGYNARPSGDYSLALGGVNSAAPSFASIAIGGYDCYAGGSYSVAIGGNACNAYSNYSFAHGYLSNASADHAICLSGNSDAAAEHSFTGGWTTKTTIMGQFSRGFGLTARGDNQMSIITVGKAADIAPSTLVKLTTDPSTASASTTYGLVMAGDNRSWAVNYQLTYVCTVSTGGANDPAVGDTYTEEGTFFAKKIAGVVVSATQPVDYVATHDAYYVGGKVPVLSTTFAGSEVKLNVTTGATTNSNTYRILATLTITEVAW